ncbi:hypothetical protein PLUTE_a4477 [Pseudoalteromonas luteoviolacea DSM 6061]|nr:hypothetical protein [Pseudoalteromonas luteoviolacea DSM 6061]
MRSLDKALLKGVVGGSVYKPSRPHSACATTIPIEKKPQPIQN